MRRLEPVLVGPFLASWIFSLLDAVGVKLLAGSLNLSFYSLYISAAVIGWVAGNVYNFRRRALPVEIHRRLLLLYSFGPAGVVVLLRSLASVEAQEAAPFVWLFAVAVYAIFFLVPILLRPPASPRPPRIGRG